MSSVQETAYPRLNTEVTEQELIAVFTPTEAEEAFVSDQFRQAPTRALLLIQLKLLQRLGNFIPLVEVPRPIIAHVYQKIGTRPLEKSALARYDQSGSKWIHYKWLRAFVGIQVFEGKDHAWLETIAFQAAQTKQKLSDIIIQAQLQKAMDDIAEIFIKTVRNMHHVAEERLREYKLQHADETERLIGQFREVLTAFHHDGSEPERLARIDRLLDGDPEPWMVRCDEHLAFAGNNYYPFMLQPYRSKRALLFQCLEALSLRSSSQDESLLRALSWMQRFRSSHREYLAIESDDLAALSFDWLPDKWGKMVFGKAQGAAADRSLHRKYFELCVFSQVMQELKSDDLYVEHSDQYDDYRNHLVSWEECRKEIAHYGELVGLPMDSVKFVNHLEQQLKEMAQQVDDRFPDNEHVDISESGLVIRRTERQQPPPNLEIIDQAVTETMNPASILDILTETEQWLDLHTLFGPLPGFEAKIDDPRKRFISTLFCSTTILSGHSKVRLPLQRCNYRAGNTALPSVTGTHELGKHSLHARQVR